MGHCVFNHKLPKFLSMITFSYEFCHIKPYADTRNNSTVVLDVSQDTTCDQLQRGHT
jgi:hypothetical protein